MAKRFETCLSIFVLLPCHFLKIHALKYTCSNGSTPRAAESHGEKPRKPPPWRYGIWSVRMLWCEETRPRSNELGTTAWPTLFAKLVFPWPKSGYSLILYIKSICFFCFSLRLYMKKNHNQKTLIIFVVGNDQEWPCFSRCPMMSSLALEPLGS